jgi:hypothetical protein
MDMPKPTAAHRRFESMAGNWRGTEIMHPSPWDPVGGTATGQTTSRVALDGFTMVGDYKQERNGMVTFQGHSVWSYDTKDNCYLFYWWDSMGSPVNIFKGNFDGDKLTMVCSDYSGTWRLTYDYSTPGTLKSKMEISQDGQNFNPFFEGAYQKAAAAAPKAAKKPAKKALAKKAAKPMKKKMAKPVKKAKGKKR